MPQVAPERRPFPIVGVGASAGGLSAFEAFFSTFPPDPGVAFVLVQHLAPGHESLLVALMRRFTALSVVDIEDGVVMGPNTIYVTPPGKDVAVLAGALHLLESLPGRGPHLPIDFFFRSLAQDQHTHAVAVVLSGTGSDGSVGVTAIKAEGGMVMAQHPASAEFEGMPRSAIATGLVDFTLPPAEMAPQLLSYVKHSLGSLPRKAPAPSAEAALTRIFVLLRAHSGHDFSHYKPETILRRVQRRMAVHQIEPIEGYVRYLQQTPAELDALFRDLLIGVTAFFRDAEAFRQLAEQVIPALFAGKAPGSTIRVWSAGCSTGEEAYSVAILLREFVDAQTEPFKIQVFGTDIDDRAITSARRGRFPAAAVADLSADRRARFFTADRQGGGVQVQKRVRDMMVFSLHDVVRDPAFSKMDLIICRNVMIYMGTDLQARLLHILHYALNPGGVLFLGASESVGALESNFVVVDRAAKLFRCAPGTERATRTVVSPPAMALPMPGTARAAPVGGERPVPGASMRAGGADPPSARRASERPGQPPG